jgi:fructose-bisphosphate aldolase class I
MTSFDLQLEKLETADGFIAALDQSGGSTPKALRIYGIPDDWYVVGEKSMFDAIHSMRTRIMKSPVFNGERILGAILFEDTMDRTVHGIETARYLWSVKNIVPFLKVDKGLMEAANGVQLMKPIPDLNVLLARAKEAGVFGTKMRSVITQANERGIEEIVDQQFELGKQITAAGLIPVIEPEVDVNSPEKKEAEVLLKVELLKHLDALAEGEKVILKLSLPSVDNFYKECIEHPKCLRVVALSGGYSRALANEILARQHGMIASFSRALTEGLAHQMSEKQFEATLDGAIRSIFEASSSG